MEKTIFVAQKGPVLHIPRKKDKIRIFVHFFGKFLPKNGYRSKNVSRKAYFVPKSRVFKLASSGGGTFMPIFSQKADTYDFNVVINRTVGMLIDSHMSYVCDK